MSSKKTRNPKEQEITLTVFSNTPADEAAYQVLQMFYKGAVVNNIGLMRAYNVETDQEELLLVGMEVTEEKGIDAYPLAKILVKEDVSKYLSPDGKGGWHGKEPSKPNLQLVN